MRGPPRLTSNCRSARNLLMLARVEGKCFANYEMNGRSLLVSILQMQILHSDGAACSPRTANDSLHGGARTRAAQFVHSLNVQNNILSSARSSNDPTPKPNKSASPLEISSVHYSTAQALLSLFDLWTLHSCPLICFSPILIIPCNQSRWRLFSAFLASRARSISGHVIPKRND